jgi:hypothetical protein
VQDRSDGRFYFDRCLTLAASRLYGGASRTPTPQTKTMRLTFQTCAILTDSHFLIPLIVFCIGLALLITLH